MVEINLLDDWEVIKEKMKEHKEELSKEIVDIVNNKSDSDDCNTEFIADNVIYGRRNGKRINAEKMAQMRSDAAKAMAEIRQGKHEEVIKRYANEVTDAVVNGEPQEEVMKKAMDFTKEIDELKEKETHWDKEPTFGYKYTKAFESKFRPELNDPVSHPAHYTTGKIECIEYIEDKGLGFHLGNAVKYITRAGKKSPGKKIEDLRKAMWYIDRYIQLEEKREREEIEEMVGNRTE